LSAIPSPVNDALRRRLFVVLVGYEIAIVSVIMATGVSIALASGGTIAAAAPIIVIGLAESMRIPLAGWSVKLSAAGKMLAWLTLLAIALASFEGLALVFSIYIDNRLSNVLSAQHRLESVQHIVDQNASDVSAFTAEIAELDAESAALAKSMPQPPAGTNRVCTWKGQRVTCAADAIGAATYQTAMKAYDSRLNDITAKRAASQARIDAKRNEKGVRQEIEKARQDLDEELARSPMHRLAASLFGVRVSNLTEDQFGLMKRIAVIGLAGTFATLSMLVSLVVHLEPKSDARPSKLSRAFRAMIAARRKKLRRVEERVRTEFRDKFIYVPTDPVSGRVLDPDLTR
jgi:hypothetical protein